MGDHIGFLDDAIGQHFDGLNSAQWSPDKRLVQRMVRTYGRDQSTGEWLVCDGTAVPTEPSSIGYRNDAALWYPSLIPDPSGTIRPLALWADAYPGVVTQSGGGTTSDPYKSKVSSQTYVTPAFGQDPNDPSAWIADTGLVQQRVAPAGGIDLPVGTPVVVLPFSVTTEQAMAAIPAGGTQLIAVWKGGPPEGKLGTLEYDVKPDGTLDLERRARLQTTDRVWRLPKTGLLPFGSAPGADKKPFPPSSSIAWQLGLDVDSQAGYGSIVDQVAGTPPTSTQTPTGGPAGASGGSTQERPTVGQATGSVPETTSGGTPKTTSAQSVIALTSRRAFGGHSVGQVVDKHHIADTPDQEPVNAAHWNVRQPIDGDGFDAPVKTDGLWVEAGDGGPLIVEVFCRYDPNDSHPFLGGARDGLRKWEVRVPIDVTPTRERKTGGFDKFAGKDAGKDSGSDKRSGKDAGKDSGGDGIKPAPRDEGKIPDDAKGFSDPSGDKPGDRIKFPGGDKFGRTDGGTTGGTTGGGIKLGDQIKFSGGDKFGRTDGGAPRPPIEKPIEVPVGLIDTFTFGGGILYGGQNIATDGGTPQDSGNPITTDRGYARSPLEIAGPGFLGRPTSLGGSDLRGRTTGLTDDQLSIYDSPTPISGAISAVASQTGGGYQWFGGAGPGSGLYDGGATEAGGFALHPANTDIRDIQGQDTSSLDGPLTTFYASTFDTQFAVADPGLNGLPMDGYSWGRGSKTTCSIDWWDSNGATGSDAVGGLPSAIYLDSGQSPTDPPPSALIWGGQVVTVWNTTNGQAASGTVFVSDGTNAGPGGTWQTPASLGNPGPGVFGDGSDGAATFNGGAAPTGSTFDGAITYTLSRDVYYSSITMTGVYRLNTAGWRIFCSGTFTIGASNRVGSDGVAAVAGAAGAGVAAQTVGESSVGGAGVSRTTAGLTGGSAGGAEAASFGGQGGTGGAGDGIFAGGGAGGAVTRPASNMGELRQTPQISMALLISWQGVAPLNGGTGGGSGGVSYNALSTGTYTSGAGGGGGGVVMIAAKKLVNSGVVAADGGPGGVGTAGGGTAGGAGGGGGGGGGLVVVVYGSTGSTLGTVQANGGNGAAGAGTAGAAPQAGANGAAGRVRTLAL